MRVQVSIGNHEYDWLQQPWKPSWANFGVDSGLSACVVCVNECHRRRQAVNVVFRTTSASLCRSRAQVPGGQFELFVANALSVHPSLRGAGIALNTVRCTFRCCRASTTGFLARNNLNGSFATSPPSTVPGRRGLLSPVTGTASPLRCSTASTARCSPCAQTVLPIVGAA